MSTAQKINKHVLTIGFTAISQKPLPGRVAPGMLLSITNQATRTHHAGIRVTAHADRVRRGWTERDVYRMRDLLDYADSIGDPAPLVVVAETLKPDAAVAVLGARLAYTEAVREIADRLAGRAETAAADYQWWITEHPDVLAG